MKLAVVFLLMLTCNAIAADPSSPDLRSLADQAKASCKAAEDATKQARASASLYLQAAESHCREMLAGDPDYANMAAEAGIAKKDLQKARDASDSRAETDASSRLNHAIARMKEMEAQFMATDEDVVQAKAIAAKFDSPAIQPSSSDPKTPDAAPKVPFRHFEQIQTGMTKPELESFLHRNASKFKITDDTFSPDRRSESMRVAVLVRDDRTVETQDIFGGWHQGIQKGYTVAGYLTIELTDGIVTEAQHPGSGRSYQE